MMKRKYIIILIVFLAIIITITSLRYRQSQNKNTPDRPKKVPVTAIWKGDIDEGFWIEYVSINKDSSYIRLRVYNDYNGNMIYDANFSTQSDCCTYKGKSIFNNICYFEFDKIVLNNGCVLKIKHPVFDGEWKDNR